MSKDIFGYDTNSQVGGVLNFQNAAVKIGGKDLMLVQTANLRYTRTVSPVMGAGTATVYLVPQPGSGTLDVGRAILAVDGKPLDPYASEDACTPKEIQIALVQNGCNTNDGGSITASGLLSGVNISINVGGGLGLQDGAQWTLTNLQIK